MPKVDLKLYSTAAREGTKQTTTVQYVNPNVSNAVLKEFAQKLNSFTTNTYSEADRIETINVDTDSSRKQFRNITVTNVSPGSTATITFNTISGESYTPIVFFWTSSGTTYIQPTASQSADPTLAKYVFTVPNSTGVVYVAATVNDNFYADFIRQATS